MNFEALKCHAISIIGRVEIRESTPLNMSFGLRYEINIENKRVQYATDTMAQLTNCCQVGFDDGL